MPAAERAVTRAKTAARDADSELAKAQADTANAQREYKDRGPAARKAQDRLEQACEDVAAAMRELAQRHLDDRIRPSGQADFAVMLQAACVRLSESGDDDQDQLLSTSARQLLGPARSVEQALADAGAGAENAARESETDAARAADKLSRAEKAHDEAASRLATARKRHAAAQA